MNDSGDTRQDLCMEEYCNPSTEKEILNMMDEAENKNQICTVSTSLCDSLCSMKSMIYVYGCPKAQTSVDNSRPCTI